MKPLFVVLDGIDGCGKTTQIGLLASHIFRMHKSTNVILTREPTGISPASRRLRELLAMGGSEEQKQKEFLELFLEDRRFHIDKIIKPALELGITVVSERYKYSTFAYQMAQGLAFGEIADLHKNMPVPDLTVFLDTKPEEALRRKVEEVSHEGLEAFEKEEFLGKVRENYLSMPKKLPDERIVVIPANGSQEEVFKKVRDEFLMVWSSRIIGELKNE